MICLGIDGGGTTTRAVVVRFENGALRVLDRGEAASSNHYSAGFDTAIENIRLAANEALQCSNIGYTDIAAWGLGLAGACTSSEQSLLQRYIAPLAQGATVIVDEDVAAAHAGAFACFNTGSITLQSGVICIAGTGANSFGIGENGQRARADGLGQLLGDRGSGYRIGEYALRAACSAADGSGPTTKLLNRVLDSFQVTSIDALVPLVYSSGFNKDRVAALVPVVLACAQEGDLVAIALLQKAAEELAATCGSVMRQLNTHRVAFSGGIISNPTPVRTRLEELLRQQNNALEVVQSAHDAAIGAAILAYLSAPVNK